MKLIINGINIYFPYEYIYPEQIDYIKSLLRCLLNENNQRQKGHAILEMPTGTGKTVSILSLIISLHSYFPNIRLLYCTRTLQEISHVIEEIRRIHHYLKVSKESKESKEASQHISPPPQSDCYIPPFLSNALSSRRNLCIHPDIRIHDSREKIDSLCHNLTADWVIEDIDLPHCPYYQNLLDYTLEGCSTGIYDIIDLYQFGTDHKICPYYLSRRLVDHSNIIVCSYQYLLNPKASFILENYKDCIVICDEAHNIDNICCDTLSLIINERNISGSLYNLSQIEQLLNQKAEDQAYRLQNEYQRLVDGLSSSSFHHELIPSPILSRDEVKEYLPGSLRNGYKFLRMVHSFIMEIKNKVYLPQITQEKTLNFLSNILNSTNITQIEMKFFVIRLASLFAALQIQNVYEFFHLIQICEFATMISTYDQGFTVLHDRDINGGNIELVCMDATIVWSHIIDLYPNVILTSGTLSPHEYYHKLLGFQPSLSLSFPNTLSRNCICPLIVTKGSDQLPISTKFSLREDRSILHNYGLLITELSSLVPDGLVVYFPSYSFLEETLASWDQMGFLIQISASKLIFIERPDIVETTLALDHFRKTCCCGRGAIFFSVARGKVAEGIDFNDHYGRCVIILGVPFQYTQSRRLICKLDYLSNYLSLPPNDFLSFDAMRQAAQCCGRCIRSKTDYGLLVLADMRFSRFDKRNKLPLWIKQYLESYHLQLSVDSMAAIAKDFFKEMGQPLDKGFQDIGIVRLTYEQVFSSSLIHSYG